MSNERTRILVVDDEEIVRESLGGWLEKDGYTVSVAPDGPSAVKRMQDERWSIVIADLSNKTTLMHARLAESVTPFNQALADPAAAMLDPRTDTGRALLEQLMSQQAAIMAYSNNFKLMTVMTLLAFPLIALVRVEKGLRPADTPAVVD